MLRFENRVEFDNGNNEEEREKFFNEVKQESKIRKR